MVTDKYGNKTRLGWNEYSLELFEAVAIAFRTDEYLFPEFNESASTKIEHYWRYSEPQLELMVMLKVRIDHMQLEF